ncbi:MAG: hypothetical protein NT001_04010 [Candidatus Woesearchaeota archaeon]|nr:hypothetical protein [Candidatus Woesearchaeota archaeon]
MIYHIDMSNNYHQKDYSILALVSVSNKDLKKDGYIKKGVIITEPLRSDLLKEFSEIQLHSSLISILIKDLIPFKKVIICPDIKPIKEVIMGVCKLHPELTSEHLKSLSELREEIGNDRYKSEADAFAKAMNRNFKKRKNIHRNNDFFDNGSILIISNLTSSSGQSPRPFGSTPSLRYGARIPVIS